MSIRGQDTCPQDLSDISKHSDPTLKSDTNTSFQVTSPSRRFTQKIASSNSAANHMSTSTNNHHQSNLFQAVRVLSCSSNTVEFPQCSKLCVPEKDQAWPNLDEGQTICIPKHNAPNESFAQKVQTGIKWNNTSYKGPGNHRCAHRQKYSSARKEYVHVEECSTLDSCGSCSQANISQSSTNHSNRFVMPSPIHNHTESIKSQSLFSSKPQIRKGKKRNTEPKNLPCQDSRVHIIDSSEKEMWMQASAIKTPVQRKPPLVLEKDFPDLESDLKLYSNCFIKNEVDESTEDGQETCSPKFKKKQQPRREDPISVNIADIIKQQSEVFPKKKSLVDRRRLIKDYERTRLGGNVLDSSNPIRKKGKHRERAPKRHISKMKLVILNERHKKQEQREKTNLVFGHFSIEELYLKSVCDKLASMQIVGSCLKNSEECSPCSTQQEESVGAFESVSHNVSGKSLIPDHSFDHVSSSSSVHSDFTVYGKAISANVGEPSKTIPIQHSRKFREYCNNIRSCKLDEATMIFLKEIYRFQDRLHHKDPVKAFAKRRYILGIREVKKFLALNKLKAIFIAPDLEPCQATGGLDETITQIREEGRAQKIPVVFAAGRRNLGRAFKKKVPISAVGIMNPEGAEELYEVMLREWHIAVQEYSDKADDKAKERYCSLP